MQVRSTASTWNCDCKTLVTSNNRLFIEQQTDHPVNTDNIELSEYDTGCGVSL